MALITTANNDIDQVAEQVDTTERVARTMLIQADDDNSGSVYIGAAGVATTTGYRLAAGKALRIVLNEGDGAATSIKNTAVYAIGSADNQKVQVFYQ